MKKYRNLLFDLDHTLWDFEKNSQTTLEELYSKYHFERFFSSISEFLDIYHRINSMLWSLYGRGKISKHTVKYERFSKCLKEGGCLDQKLAIKIADDYVQISPCKTNLIEGTIEVLQSLQGPYNMYIITNGFNEVQFKKIHLSGLSHYFEKVFTSEDAGFQKPDNGFFQYVFNTPDLFITDSLVIGDNLLTDIGGAKSFGVDSVYFNPDGNKDFMGATFIISKLRELLSIL